MSSLGMSAYCAGVLAQPTLSFVIGIIRIIIISIVIIIIIIIFTNRRRNQHIVASSVCVLAIAASVGPGELAYCAGLLAQPFCRRRAFLAVSVFSSRLHHHPRDHTLSPPTIVVVDSSSSSVGPLSSRSRRFIGPVVLVLR